jgi:hypothetical protein
MSLTSPDREHQAESPREDSIINSTGLSILIAGGAASAVAFYNQPLGIAIGVGLATVGLLVKIVRRA